jgi:alkaline phosphatase
MAGDEPLLARPSSDNSSERNIEEEDALLTGQHVNRPNPAASNQRWREFCLFAWAMLATVAVIVLAVVYQHESSVKHTKSHWGPDGKPTGKRNMIFMVSDGMGPTSLSLTRSFRQYTSGLPVDDVLVLDRHLIGSSRTRSTSSLITDSAAGATAFSCGLKSYNGAISVLPDHSPCGTVLEAAKKAGYMTGLVVTTRITDATPACFASHANRREYEDLIAEQLVGHYPLGRVVDLILGGGRCHFLPNGTEGSCRANGKDVVEMAKKNGYSYIDNRDDFDKLAADVESGVKLPLLGLVADRDIPYEIDRVHVAHVYPSQAEMTKLALKALSAATRDSDKGFFIMIEGSRIDHAGHANDPAAQVHEVLAHDEAFAAVLDFLQEDDTPGVLVSTSDHETGGLATARQLHQAYPHYVWYPSQLVNVTHSTEYLAREYARYLAEEGYKASRSEKAEFLRSNIIVDGLGVTDVSDEEIDAIIDAEPIWPPFYLFGDIVSRRAQVGWSTHGHSGTSDLPGAFIRELSY